MAITIQEIIASDTLSQVADKINFNFDQILLNGGGPSGPIGPIGPPGPIGGRGERGSEWYEDPNSVATDPNTIIVSPDLLEGDYYLDFDGAVWEYNGTVWNQTTVNLQGPQGIPGQSQGLDYFGQTPNLAIGETSIYTTPMPNADLPSSGANAVNEAIPTLVLGAVPTTQTPPAILLPTGFTSAYQINATMASSIESNKVTLFVHQKDSGGHGIKFMGGGANNADKYEQNDFLSLASIDAGIDDGISINVPKSATSPLTTADLIGFNVSTPQRGQQFFAGKQIEFFTGATTGGAVDSSDFTISLGGISPKYQMGVNTGGTALMEMGTGVSLVPGFNKTGNLMLHSFDSRIQSDGSASMVSVSNMQIESVSGNISIAAEGGNVDVNTVDFNVTTTESIKLDNNANGTTPSSIQILSGDVISAVNGVTPPAILNGSSKLEMRSKDSMRLMTIEEGMSIQAGYSATSADLTEIAFGGDLELFAAETLDPGSTSQGDIKLTYGLFNQGGTTVLRVRGNESGNIFIGDNAITSYLDGSSYRPMIGIATTNSGTQDRTQTIRFGRAAAAQGSGLQQYYGGAEIVGPFVTVAKNANTWFDRSGKENETALHLRGGLDSSGKNPGDVWMYNTTATGQFTPAEDNFSQGNIRIWGTSTNRMYVNTAFGSQGGTTIGLDGNEEKSDIGGPNVKGRVTLYGNATTTNGLDSVGPRPTSTGGNGPTGSQLNQNIPYPNNPSSANGYPAYAGVNVGDAQRGRQTFKVFGDYVGDHYVSVFGGAQSGPGIETQCFMSGAQGFGPTSGYVVNAGSNNQDDDIGFQYMYQWQRVGRVVTGSGRIKFAGGLDGSSGSTPSWTPLNDGVVAFGGNFDKKVTVGPIPLPMQVSTGNFANSSTDGKAEGFNDSGAKLGMAGGLAIAGTVMPNLDFLNNNLGTVRVYGPSSLQSNSYQLGGDPGALQMTGCVRSGTLASMSTAMSSTAESFMWLVIYPMQDPTGTYFGIVPHNIQFTFTYELRATT